MSRSKYKNKETGEIIEAEKGLRFDDQTLVAWNGYMIFRGEQAEFMADIYFLKMYEQL